MLLDFPLTRRLRAPFPPPRVLLPLCEPPHPTPPPHPPCAAPVFPSAIPIPALVPPPFLPHPFFRVDRDTDDTPLPCALPPAPHAHAAVPRFVRSSVPIALPSHRLAVPCSEKMRPNSRSVHPVWHPPRALLALLYPPALLYSLLPPPAPAHSRRAGPARSFTLPPAESLFGGPTHPIVSPPPRTQHHRHSAIVSFPPSLPPSLVVVVCLPCPRAHTHVPSNARMNA